MNLSDYYSRFGTQKQSEECLTHKVSAAKTPQVLLAEDDDEMRRLIARALTREDYEVKECRDGYELLGYLLAFVPAIQPVKFDVIISDIRMPGFTGREAFRGVCEYEGTPPMILITAFGDNATHAEAQRLGVAAMFDKPFEITDLMAKVRELVSPQSPLDHEQAVSRELQMNKVGFPVEIVHRHYDFQREQAEKIVHRYAPKLNHFNAPIQHCKVVIDAPHHHHRRGNSYLVRIHLLVPGRTLVVGHDTHKKDEHKNLHTAIGDAFEAAVHPLKTYPSTIRYVRCPQPQLSPNQPLKNLFTHLLFATPRLCGKTSALTPGRQSASAPPPSLASVFFCKISVHSWFLLFGCGSTAPCSLRYFAVKTLPAVND